MSPVNIQPRVGVLIQKQNVENHVGQIDKSTGRWIAVD